MEELNEIEEGEIEILKSLNEIKMALNIKEQNTCCSKSSKKRPKAIKSSKATSVEDEATWTDTLGEAAQADVIEEVADADAGTRTTNVFDTLTNEVGAVKNDVKATKDKMDTLESIKTKVQSMDADVKAMKDKMGILNTMENDVKAMKDKMDTLEGLMAQIIELVTPDQEKD